MRKGGEKRKSKDREKKREQRPFAVLYRYGDSTRRQYAAFNKIIPERGREREEVQPPLTTMRHFIINPPVAPPCARPQSEIQIKHANICVFYSRGFVGRPRFVTCSRSAPSLIRFVINTSADAANYLLRVLRGQRRGEERRGEERRGEERERERERENEERKNACA